MYKVETGIGTVRFNSIDDLVFWLKITDIAFNSFEITIEKN